MAVQSPSELAGGSGDSHSSARLKFPSLSLPFNVKLALCPNVIGELGHVSVPCGGELGGGGGAQVIVLGLLTSFTLRLLGLFLGSTT